ncbi:hypothetical protein LZ554_006353 [Drepanopeziza brunnea f. sp. 'monogermtubi']|nr:hypothetical protein LZ554_006353 [Drepanopeziza brunnea f. sp. 'monogermtubi']
MFVNTIVAAAILAASVVTAAPSTLVARQRQGTVHFCLDPNYVDCYDKPYTVNECVDFPKKDKFNDAITSMQLYGVKCRFYELQGCSSLSFELTRDIPDFLLEETLTYNDWISSFKCGV